MELGVELAEQLRNDRRSPEYLAAYEDPDPLVSVCIGTYNRGRLLTERAIPSVLAQTHRNVEVIVVGDCCTDDTAERISHIRDDRLRFVNLPERGRYPEEPYLRWMVAGTVPFNHALSLTRGQFVTHLDDDDEYLPDRVARLLTYIRETRADLVFHPFYAETPQGNWTINPAAEFFRAQVTTSSTFYHRWFARIRWDLHAYLLQEEGDWNRHRKIVYLGARIERYSEPLLRHYKERANQ
jgi:glycosyltransferase involved in cell wall biosynthesis